MNASSFAGNSSIPRGPRLDRLGSYSALRLYKPVYPKPFFDFRCHPGKNSLKFKSPSSMTFKELNYQSVMLAGMFYYLPSLQDYIFPPHSKSLKIAIYIHNFTSFSPLQFFYPEGITRPQGGWG